LMKETVHEMYIFADILEWEEISRLTMYFLRFYCCRRCRRNNKGGVGLPPFKIHARSNRAEMDRCVPKISWIVEFTELRRCDWR
jgi:hypothetical protein